MDHDVGLVQNRSDEIGSLIEIGTDVKTLMVISRNVQHIGDQVFGVVEVNPLRGCQDGLDGMFYVLGVVLWRVLRFCAASRLPI